MYVMAVVLVVYFVVVRRADDVARWPAFSDAANPLFVELLPQSGTVQTKPPRGGEALASTTVEHCLQERRLHHRQKTLVKVSASTGSRS